MATTNWKIFRFLFLSNLLFLSSYSANDNDEDTCGLYLAESTIPGAGLGVFTSKPRQKGDHIGYGDVCIPIKDLEWQYSGGNEFVNPFGDYVWLGDPLGLKQEIGPFQLISAFWPGLNAAVNCHPAILNVERANPRYDNFDDSLHRSKDPSVGSFSPYHNGSSIVTHFIPEGGEFFTSYGDNWFVHRLHTFPPNFPVPTSYEMAGRFIQRFQRNMKSRKNQEFVYSYIQDLRDNVWTDSRFLQALPKDLESLDLALKEGLRSLFQKNTTRSIEYLENHGTCLDNIIPGESTINGAGRGAFAQRFLPKDTVITTSPLIHILEPSLLDIHEFSFDMEEKTYAQYGKIGSQLVLNYCFGHKDATILLCPYSSGVNYINHNQSLANIRLAWPNDGRLNHNDTWLATPLSQWKIKDKKSRLALEYIAIRDIQPGEELFLDYGEDWELAYVEHVKNWNSPEDFAGYIPATKWNSRHKNQDILRTEEETRVTPYPESLELRCHKGLSSSWGYRYHALKWDDDLDRFNPEYGNPCRVIRRREEKLGEITYDVIITEIDESGEKKDTTLERKKIPRTALKWFDKPESTDMHLPGAFRHAIGLPDDILPNAWRTHRKPEEPLKIMPACDLYLADSTIPNAGLGMFTSKPLNVGDFVGNGDVTIMLTDMALHNGNEDEDDYFDMTMNYVWDAKTFGFANEVDSKIGTIHALWPGINAAVNYNSFLVNVDSTTGFPEYDDADLHRSQSPGAGAFSPYHLGLPKVNRKIPAGAELFKDYGPDWFIERDLPEIPEPIDIYKAQIFLNELFTTQPVNENLYGLVLDFRKIWLSRPLNALPDTFSGALKAFSGEIADNHQPKATREISWLEENGRCADHIVPGKSTLDHAGHGAFAKRFLPKGTIVSGSPLLHGFEKTLEMFHLHFNNGPVKDLDGSQILLNYCFGHHDSTLLLCPYGSGINYINHNQTLANVKIQWAPNGTMAHNSSWLALDPMEMEWNYKPSLGIDYIAIKDIEEGEELFMDYGDIWEKAWKRHVKEWKPKKEWESYLPAATLNKILAKNALRTQEEQAERPYPRNLVLKCDLGATMDESLTNEREDMLYEPDYQPCRILDRYSDDLGTLYNVQIQLDDEGKRFTERFILRGNIEFFDLPYTNDLHLRPAFRHKIGLPMEMVPSVWRNKKPSQLAQSEKKAGFQSNEKHDEL